MPDKKTYIWLPDIRRFRSPDGVLLTPEEMKDAVDRAALAYSQSLHVSTLALVNDFSPERFTEWSRETRIGLTDFHNAVAVIALGGREAAITFSVENETVWNAVGFFIALQLRYFDRFMLGVVGGAIPVNGAMASRAAMYPLAGYGTYENTERLREAVAGGNREERRMLQSGNPCDTCIIEAAKGWQPLGTLRYLGDSECRSRCRCYFIYR